MERAWIAGKPASLESAIAEAARLLAASRQPLIAGLATDVAGARANHGRFIEALGQAEIGDLKRTL